MRIKKIILMLIMIFCLNGCVNLDSLEYDDIVNNFSEKAKSTNTYKQGYQYYIPRGLQIKDSGPNYAIISDGDINYYVYFDLVSYNEKKEISYELKPSYLYSKSINSQNKKGYVEIKLWKNNQYLIEIMYNYAKIEVMVDEAFIKEVLINSINILNSIKYNDIVIESMLSDDNLNYTEEIFDMFEESKDNLDNNENKDEIEIKDDIQDTDYIN